jgi:hypothetical protein
MVAVVAAACMRMAATLVVLVELAVPLVAKLVQSLTDFVAPADECLAITVLIEMCLLSPGLLPEIYGSTAQGMLGTSSGATDIKKNYLLTSMLSRKNLTRRPFN